MVQRKVLFHRVTSSTVHYQRSNLDLLSLMQQVDQLEFSSGERYWQRAPGDDIVVWVDSATYPIKFRIGRSRRTYKPPQEEGGVLGKIPMNDAAGIAELSHGLIFDSGVVVSEYNHFSPRVTVLPDYIRNTTGIPVDFRLQPIVDQSALQQILGFNKISRIHIKLIASEFCNGEELSLGNIQTRFSDDRDGSIEIVMSTRKKSGFSVGIVERFKEFIRSPDNVSRAERIRVHGSDDEAGPTTPLDVFDQRMLAHVFIERESGEERLLSREDAYSKLYSVYMEHKEKLTSAPSLGSVISETA